jgi:ABC-type nickel/cobalt efflux system permease component RcnA
VPNQTRRTTAQSGTPEGYRQAWDSFTRLNRNATGALLGLIIVPVSTVLFLVLSPGHLSEVTTESTIYLAGLALAVAAVAVLYTRWRLLAWHCPRCGEKFHRPSLFNQWSIYFQTACAHCALRVGDTPE